MQNSYCKTIFLIFLVFIFSMLPSLLLAVELHNAYITPQKINPKKDVSIRVNCSLNRTTLESNGYPRLYVYKNGDLTNPIKINGNTYTILPYIQGPNTDATYGTNLGKFSVGSYTCKILAYNNSDDVKVYFTSSVNDPTITEYAGAYVTPEQDINPSKEVYIQATCTGGDEGVNLASEYPRVYIYKSNDLNNPIKVNGILCNVLSYIQGSGNGYRVNLGKFSVGSYTYKIVVQNEFGKEKTVSGTFVSTSVNPPKITKYAGVYMTPEENINPKKEILIQATCTGGDEGVNLASEYPRVYVYDKFNNPVEIDNNSFVVLLPIENSVNGYRASIGKFPLGEYTYKIVAKNECGVESYINGAFSSSANVSIIAPYASAYIIPENINPKKEVFAQMKYTGDEGVNLASEYPRVYVYDKFDNPVEINSSTFTVLLPIENSVNGYRASIGKFPLGEYTYKIVAKNEFGVEGSVDGAFSSSANTPIITEYEDLFISPEGNIIPTKEIFAQITYIGDEGVNLASEYPRVYVYDKFNNPVEIDNNSFVVLLPIENSVNGYRASINKFSIGEYSYKIVAKNEFGLESSINGTFSSVANTPIITEYEDLFISPEENLNPSREILIQATCTGGDEGVNLASEYPRVYVYDKFDNPVEINSSTFTVLLPIENSVNGYRASIGKFPIGEYSYKIVAKNEIDLESFISRTFKIEKLDIGICLNAPNPFNPNRTTTTIRFNCNEPETVTIKIFSLNGKLVFKDTYDAKAGTNDYIYKGNDGNGNVLYNGVYLCIIEKKEGNVKCKIAIVK